MSKRDESWTIAPVFGWFVGFLAIGLVVHDGGLDALADRLMPGEGGEGPVIAGPIAQPSQIAQEDDGGGGGSTTTTTGGGGGSAVAPSTSGGASNGALEDTCIDGTPDHCKRWAMDGFIKAVKAERAGKLGRPVRVSWYGDSVIATDAIPGHLRVKMQGELGDGGPGFIAAVAPHRFNGHEAVARSSSGGWATWGISTQTNSDGLYGVANTSTETSDGGKVAVKLNSGTASVVELYYLSQPHGGSATVSADGTEVFKVDTKGDKKQTGYTTGKVDGAKRFEVEASGKVRLFGIDLENGSGAVVDNMGIVSANVKSFANHDAAVWSEQLGHRSADLILIMIGANEAQWLGPYDQDTKDYASKYEKLLAPIRKGRPDATCLVVSPTDQAEEKDGSYPSRPVMPILVEAQKKAAKAQGCAFFSTYDWMGGKSSATKWFQKGLISGDFQHLTTKGANKLADAVFDAVMAGAK